MAKNPDKLVLEWSPDQIANTMQMHAEYAEYMVNHEQIAIIESLPTDRVFNEAALVVRFKRNHVQQINMTSSPIYM